MRNERENFLNEAGLLAAVDWRAGRERRECERILPGASNKRALVLYLAAAVD